MTVQELIIHEANAQGVDPDLALRVAQAESNFNQNARSPVGAIGVFQLMPPTAADLGVDPYVLEENVRGGIRYIGQMLAAFGGDPAKALAAYNWGIGRMQRAISTYGDAWGDHIPTETRNYLGRILGQWPAGAGGDAQFSMTVLGAPLMPDWVWILLALGVTYLAVKS